MSQANYTHVQELFAGIEAMLVSGKRKEKWRSAWAIGINMP